MPDIEQMPQIVGVKLVRLKAWTDERGRFMEVFRKEWFPERSWEVFQTNYSQNRAGVLRGLHYHRRQVDYWFVAAGTIRVGLADLRPASPTHGNSLAFEMGEHSPCGVFIPMGVAHGFVALTDAILTYVVDNYYDGNDELGVAWNDPALGVQWGVIDPVLSPRDRNNRLWKDIPPEQLPERYLD